MPVNALRKPGARMSLQEALERAEKLKRLTHSSNKHEAALAAMRLQTFDVDTARAPRGEDGIQPALIDEKPIDEHPLPVLDGLPDVPYETLDELEAHQPSDKVTVNWDELHVILLQQARSLGADAVANIQLRGTMSQKILAGTALRYLTSQDLFDIDQAFAIANEETTIRMEAKERRDEHYAPEVG